MSRVKITKNLQVKEHGMEFNFTDQEWKKSYSYPFSIMKYPAIQCKLYFLLLFLAILKFKRLIPVLGAAYSALVLYSALN